MFEKLFTKLGHLFVKKAKATIAIVTLLTLFFAVGLTRIEIDMGYEMMVSPDSKVYQDTNKFEENFGGDGVFLLISGKSEELITQEMLQKIAGFTEKAQQLPHISGSMDFVSMMNEMLHSDMALNMTQPEAENSADNGLAEAMQKEFSEEDMQEIEQQMQASLTDEQMQQIGAFTQSLLTEEQQMQISQALATSIEATTPEKQNELMQSLLTAEQQAEIETYTQSVLTKEQRQQMLAFLLEKLPNVEELSNETLRALVFSDNGKIPEMLGQMLPQNGDHMLINLTTEGKLTVFDSKEIVEDVKRLITETNLGDGVKVRIAGNHAINGQIDSVVMGTMGKMLILSIILMVVVLFLVFPVRRRLISLGYVLVGLVWTFGIMGWSGIPVTLATMATLPILIGLGADFGVQFHNRYEEEYIKANYNAEKAVVNSTKHIGPAVGAVACYFVEMALLFATFSLKDKYPKKEVNMKQVSTSGISKVLTGYVNLVQKFPIAILIVVVLLSAFGFMSESKIGTETNIQRMLPKDMQGVKDSNYLQEVVGSTTVITFLVEADNVTNQETINWLNTMKKDLESSFESVQGVNTIASTLAEMGQVEEFTDQQQIDTLIESMPNSIIKNMVSDDHKYSNIQVQVDPTMSSSDQLKLLDEMMAKMDAPNNVEISPAGVPVLTLYAVTNIGANSTLMKVMGVVILLIGLFIVYRRLQLAAVPVIPIVLVLGFTPLSLMLLNMDYNPLTIALSSLVLGIGAEFTILIIERYKEELDKGLEPVEAIKIAITNVGQAITASGLTVIIGFSTLIFVDFPAIREFGITTVIDVTLCLIFALTIVPALIFIFNKKGVKQSKS